MARWFLAPTVAETVDNGFGPVQELRPATAGQPYVVPGFLRCHCYTMGQVLVGLADGVVAPADWVPQTVIQAQVYFQTVYGVASTVAEVF